MSSNEPTGQIRIEGSESDLATCQAHVDVDLADEEPPNDDLTPHAFGCYLPTDHKGPHEATVSWYASEED